MAKLEINLCNKQDDVKVSAFGEDEILLVWGTEYQPGDKLIFTTDEVPAFYVIRADHTLDEAYLYLTEPTLEFAIPPEQERIAYPPACFAGEQHYIMMRKAREEENRSFRNLAKNTLDQRGIRGCYPHVHANAETAGPIAPLFAARNVIDGVLANTCHWPWPFQSWGIDRRADAEITLEFGRPVDIEELRICTRADFPHDSWWTQGTVAFSDGTAQIVKLEKTERPQSFAIAKKRITWLKLGELVRADDPSPFPALTQLEAFGWNSPET